METRITATELARNLSDILSRARYKGERFVIERNGETIATLEPAEPNRGVTWRELVTLVRDLPPVDDDFARDIESARAILREPEVPEWPN